MVPIWNTKFYVWPNYTDQFQGFFLIFAAVILFYYLYFFFLPRSGHLYHAEITMFVSRSEHESDGCHMERICRCLCHVG